MTPEKGTYRSLARAPPDRAPALRAGHWIVVSMKNDWKRIFAFDQ
jgi:hypothetical protein